MEQTIVVKSFLANTHGPIVQLYIIIHYYTDTIFSNLELLIKKHSVGSRFCMKYFGNKKLLMFLQKVSIPLWHTLLGMYHLKQCVQYCVYVIPWSGQHMEQNT